VKHIGVAISLVFLLALAALVACAPAPPPEIEVKAAALTFAPTVDGVDTPVFGPVRSGWSPRAAFGGSSFLVAWQDDRNGTRAVAAARLSLAGELLDPVNLTPPNPATERGSPAVACDGATCCLLVWEDGPYPTRKIHGLRFGLDGKALDSKDLVISSATSSNDALNPAVVWNGTDFVVLWAQEMGYYYLMGARVSPAGVVKDTTAKYLAHSTSNMGDAVTTSAVAWDGTNFMAVWREYRTGYSVVAGRFAPDLTALDGTGVELDSNTVSTDLPTVVYDGAGRYLAVWSSYDSTIKGSAIRARRLDAATGQPTSTTLELAPAAADQSRPQAILSGDRVLVLWDRWPDGVGDVVGAWVDRADTIAAVADLAALPATQWDGALASGPEGLLLTWADQRNGGSAIYASRLAADLARRDDTGVLMSYALNKERDPAVGSNGAGYLVAWVDSREGTSQIYGARLDGNAAPVAATAFAISTGAVGRGYPTVVSDGAGYLVAWTEILGSASQLGWQRVAADGSLLGTAGSSPQADLTRPRGAFANGVYLLVGSTYSPTDAVHAVRVRASDGQLLDTAPIVLTTDTARANVSSDGSAFLVAWADATDNIAGVRVATDGTLGPLLALAAADTVYPPSVAFGFGNYLLTWADSTADGILGVRVAPDGTPVDTTSLRFSPDVDLEVQLQPGVAFDGQRFIVSYDNRKYNSSYSVIGENLVAAMVDATGTITSRSTLLALPDLLLSPVPMVGGGDGRAIFATVSPDSPLAYPIDRVRIHQFGAAKVAVSGRCSATTDCSSGTCVDGVCCQTACAGGTNDCQACSVLAGAAQNGTCAPVPDGRACGATGTCAAGACVGDTPDAGPDARDASPTDQAAERPETGRDTGTGSDAVATGDGGKDVIADLGALTDSAASGGDGGSPDLAAGADSGPIVGPDAGGRDAAGPDSAADGSSQSDARTADAAADAATKRDSSGGCSCRLGENGDARAMPLLGMALAALGLLRRRRRH
jgi:MYXO-CTERM domain-containing protein